MDRTRDQLEDAIAESEETKECGPSLILRIQYLTLQANVLVRVMDKLVEESASFVRELHTKNTDAIARRVAPPIDPTEIDVPDFMPDSLL